MYVDEEIIMLVLRT